MIHTGGAQTSLALRQVETPEPGNGQLLVRMRAAGINRGEFMVGHGLLKAGAVKSIGLEISGEVVSIGPGVNGFAAGQRVLGRAPAAFSTYALMDVREAMPMPAHLSWEQAAAVPVTFIAAYEMLIANGRLATGEWLLVTAVTSGVGIAALQAGKILDTKVIGTSGSGEKLRKLEALGLDLAIQTRSPDFYDAVMAATGQHGVDMAVNNVGGSVFAECVRCLSPMGRLATIGYVDGVLEAPMNIEALHARRLKIFGMSNKFLNNGQRAAAAEGFITTLFPAIADGSIQPIVDRTFAFEDLAAAKAYVESNAQLGKVVLRGPL
ncbi:MAG: zinc-binding alcohol dehydrogenase family protein [Burkholderiales bacterium]